MNGNFICCRSCFFFIIFLNVSIQTCLLCNWHHNEIPAQIPYDTHTWKSDVDNTLPIYYVSNPKTNKQLVCLFGWNLFGFWKMFYWIYWIYWIWELIIKGRRFSSFKRGESKLLREKVSNFISFKKHWWDSNRENGKNKVAKKPSYITHVHKGLIHHP